MNIRSGKARFKNFQIILDSGRSSTIVVVKLTAKIKSKETAKTMWETQAEKFKTTKKVNVDCCLSEFIATEKVMWKCHSDEATTGK